MRGFIRSSLVLLLALPQAAQEPFNERPADVIVMMSTSRGRYDGTFTLSDVARVCGEVPKELNFAGVPTFIVQLYLDQGKGQVQDVTFDSKELVGGVTSSTKFFLSVSLKAPGISPVAYVLDTAQPKMTGTATLSTPTKGTVKLTARGVNDRGETTDLTLTCAPRKA